MKTPINLDEALRAYEHDLEPSGLTAGYVLMMATLRWQKARMSDEAYGEIVVMVANNLIQLGEDEEEDDDAEV